MSKKHSSKSTMIELVEELYKLPQSPFVFHMIEEALAGEYHDYKNKKYACGKLESSRKLRSIEQFVPADPVYVALAKRIEQGEFDEEADADDEAMMIADIDANSSNPEAALAMKKLMGLEDK